MLLGKTSLPLVVVVKVLEREDVRGRPSSVDVPLILRWEKYGDKRDNFAGS